MKKGFLLFLLFLLFSSIGYANEPKYAGTFPDGFQSNAFVNKSWIGYPSHYASSAGNVYLYKNKTNSVNYISKQKDLFMKQAKQEAKEFAVSKSKGTYAVVDLSFQVIRTENSTELYSDYYIIAW